VKVLWRALRDAGAAHGTPLPVAVGGCKCLRITPSFVLLCCVVQQFYNQLAAVLFNTCILL
jgi:hypothetical protein